MLYDLQAQKVKDHLKNNLTKVTKDNWEVIDGCILLLKELSKVQSAVNLVKEFLPAIPDIIVTTQEFKNSIHFIENVFKSLTEIL